MSFSEKFSLLTAALLLGSFGCGCQKKEPKIVEVPPVPIEVEKEAATAEDTTVPPPSETFEDEPVEFPEIEQKDTGVIYEAENGKLGTGLKFDTENEGYSGDGYVTGFAGGSGLTFTVDAPSNQHYDISFNILSTAPVDCTIKLNGTRISQFKSASDGKFTQVTLSGVFFTKGESAVEFVPDGDLCLDYLIMKDNKTLKTITYENSGETVNENAADTAKALMKNLSECYGKYMITGQYAAGIGNTEADLIYQTTGKYPVIRCSCLDVPRESFDESFLLIDSCAEWYRKGGISAVTWYWSAPSEKSSARTDETDFVLADAVTDTDLSLLSEQEIRGLYSDGSINEQTYRLVLDIDSMAGQLTSLRNKGVPVLWRPLPEGSGDWFWWGASGPESYKWLWNLLYKRLTDYFGLDNLIWVWNGQSEDTLVDPSTYDIAALDLYIDGEKDYGVQFNEKFAAFSTFAGDGKLIAISECGSIPDVDAAFRDNTVWSFFGLWHGKYLTDDNGAYSEEFTSKDSLVHLYNSDGALTLDEYSEMFDTAFKATTDTEALTDEEDSTS